MHLSLLENNRKMKFYFTTYKLKMVYREISLQNLATVF